MQEAALGGAGPQGSGSFSAGILPASEVSAGPRAIAPYRVVFVAVVIVGAMMKLEFVWNFSDLMNGMMAVPNLIGLLILSKVVKAETPRYFKR